MLHDPGHYEPPAIASSIVLADGDKTILRRLATELAAVAALPVHREKAALWRRLNDRRSVRPMVWINEIPWHEMDVDGELTLHTQHPCSNAQIFSEVSPAMHWEFAIQHDLRWLRRWGLNYYGCCEPLDSKADILKRIPNLRKVSVTPWCQTRRAVETIGPSWVMSRKPNPAIFAGDDWHPERVRQDLRDFLESARGCHVELIMKDISTVRRQPQRLWEWARIAMEEAESFRTE